MKKKRFILISLLSLFILILCFVCFVVLYNNIIGFSNHHQNDEEKETKSDKYYVDSFEFTNKRTIDICKKNQKENCLYLTRDLFDIKEKKNITEVNNFLKENNATNQEYYNRYLQSNLSDEACQLVKNNLNHRSYPTIESFLYQDDSVISIVINRTMTDVCTKDFENPWPSSYFWDIKRNREITNQEFMKLINVTEEEVLDSIETYVSSISENNQIELDMKDVLQENGNYKYITFYLSDKSLWVGFMLKDLNDKYVFLTTTIES